MKEEPEITLRSRIWLWLAAWAGAFLAVPLPAILGGIEQYLCALLVFAHFCWVFPGGLTGFAAGQRDFGWVALVLGWLIYIGLTVAALCQRRRGFYFFFYLILCALLIINVVGCQQCSWKHFNLSM